MSNKRNLATKDDIKTLVDTFYGKIQVDGLLGGIFNGIIRTAGPSTCKRCIVSGKQYCWKSTPMKEVRLHHMHSFRSGKNILMHG